MIRCAGHKLHYQSSKGKHWDKVLKKNCDLVAVAGGDGTVAKVARRMVDQQIPVGILPVGTANNIAHTLGLTGFSLERLIAGWKSARRVNFDIGVAKGPWGSSCFIEGFGAGLFATALSGMTPRIAPDGPTCRADELTEVLRTLKRRLRKHRSATITVRLDDQELSGDYILLEALNIRYVGPNLDLAPGANTNDGLLDLVVLSRGEKGKLESYLNTCIAGKDAKAGFNVRQGRHLRIEWSGFPVHIDDRPWPKNGNRKPPRANKIEIKIGSHTVVFLCPRRTRRRPRL